MKLRDFIVCEAIVPALAAGDRNEAIREMVKALAVDFLGRYESLNDDLAKVLEHLGIKRRIEVPRTNVTRDREGMGGYRQLYTDKTRDIVGEWYAPEIALLGYGF